MNNRRKSKVMLVFFAVLLISGCSKRSVKLKEEEQIVENSIEPSSTIREFHELNADEILEVMGAGWNLGNQFESIKDGYPGETYYGNPKVTKQLISAVKEAGFQTIRIPVSYMNYIGNEPEYTIDEEWLDRIQEVVDWCIDEGLYVVMDLHGDGYDKIDQAWFLCDGKNQDLIKEKYQAVWKQIAMRYKDYDEHLIFESMNEEFDGTYDTPDATYYQNLNEYNQIFLDTIRQTGGNNNKRWVLIPGWNADLKYTSVECGFEIPTEHYLSNEVPEGENRIMISIHYYDPGDFCAGENNEITQWGEDAKDISKTNNTYGEAYLAESFEQIKERFLANGYPCVISEYGVDDKSCYDSENTYYRADYCKKLCRKCFDVGCVPIYWDNGSNEVYGYGLFDRSTYEITQPEIIDGIMSVYNKDTSGTATAIHLDQNELKLQVGSESKGKATLSASIAPKESKDTLTWISSDEMVATVSSSGVVTARKQGKATITVSSNDGVSASCKVVVSPDTNIKLRLYCTETAFWSQLVSNEVADVSEDGGRYSLTIRGSKTMLENIGSLYLKDQAVEEGTIEQSVFSSAKITINAITFNGVKCSMKGAGIEQAINEKQIFDYCFLNQWYLKGQKINEVALGNRDSYYFTVTQYKDQENVLTIDFTVSDIK